MHGHIHGDENYNLQNKEDYVLRYDVGVDANGFYPVSVKQICLSLIISGCFQNGKNHSNEIRV